VVMIPATFVFSKAAEMFFGALSASLPSMLACDNPIYSLNTFAMGICAWYAWKENREKDFLKIAALLLTGFIGLNMYNRMLWGMLAAIIMMLFINLEIKNDVIVKIIKVLGRYSFCLYLVHLPVIEIIDYYKITGAAYLLLATVLSVVAAVVLYHCVEQPCGRLLRRLGEK
ncbi:MAG: acyltransferase family protein, partial [Thermoflexaceae bacterium]|nr:acyltransferase family protein [Thermoflexaceae bacterium]